MLEKTIKIEVKQEHIDNGVKGSCCNCPIALAFKESVPNYSAHVGSHSLNVYNKGSIITYYELDDKGRNLVKDFDNDKEVNPTTIEISKL